MLKKLLILMSVVAFFLLVIFVLNNSSSQIVNITQQDMDTGTLKVAVHNKVQKMGYKQYYDDEIKGLEVDIAKRLAKDIYGEEQLIDIREVSMKSALYSLDKKLVDCVIATQPKNEDSNYLYSEPYYTDYIDIIYKNGNIGSVDDLKDKKVGVISKSYAYTLLEKKTSKAKLNVTYVDYENYQEAYRDIESGKIDAFCDNRIFLSDSSYNRFTLEECKYHVVVRKDSKKLLEKINESIKKMQESGELESLTNQWK